MASDKDKAKDALDALRIMLKGQVAAQPQLEAISRYTGELRRAMSTAKQRIAELESAVETNAIHAQEANRRISELRQQVVALEKEMTPVADPDQLAEAKREQRRETKRRRLDHAEIRDLARGAELPEPAVSETKEGRREKWTAAQVRFMLLNPVYCGIGPFPVMISDRAWIIAACRMLDELGYVQFFVDLLFVLRDTLSDATYEDPAAAEELKELLADRSEDGFRNMLNSMLAELPDRREFETDANLLAYVKERYGRDLSQVEVEIARECLIEQQGYNDE